MFWFVLIHSANPQSRPVVITVFAHAVRPSIRPHFSNLAKQCNRKQWSLLARLWVWPSGSLMTPGLSCLFQVIGFSSIGSYYLSIGQRGNQGNNILIQTLCSYITGIYYVLIERTFICSYRFSRKHFSKKLLLLREKISDNGRKFCLLHIHAGLTK